ncbi:hypothetical protein COCCADRAFT_107776, partial [Bipolaris zeicola 26-R-13]
EETARCGLEEDIVSHQGNLVSGNAEGSFERTARSRHEKLLGPMAWTLTLPKNYRTRRSAGGLV